MKREKLLTIAVVLLFVLNIATIGFLFLQRGHRPPPMRMEKFIPESLGFNEEQIQQFDGLRKDHHAQMQLLDEQNKQVLVSYLQLLEADFINTLQKDSLEKIISGIQQARATVTLNHFQKLKMICNASQKQKFNALIPELTRVITDQHNNPLKP